MLRENVISFMKTQSISYINVKKMSEQCPIFFFLVTRPFFHKIWTIFSILKIYFRSHNILHVSMHKFQFKFKQNIWDCCKKGEWYHYICWWIKCLFFFSFLFNSNSLYIWNAGVTVMCLFCVTRESAFLHDMKAVFSALLWNILVTEKNNYLYTYKNI